MPSTAPLNPPLTKQGEVVNDFSNDQQRKREIKQALLEGRKRHNPLCTAAGEGNPARRSGDPRDRTRVGRVTQAMRYACASLKSGLNL